MMDVIGRFRALAAALPSDTSAVTLTRADLVALLEAASLASPAQPRDLTVDQVSERTGRAASTVRGWLTAGELRGYKLNGRDWRVPEEQLRIFLGDQPGSDGAPQASQESGVDISAWRRVG